MTCLQPWFEAETALLAGALQPIFGAGWVDALAPAGSKLCRPEVPIEAAFLWPREDLRLTVDVAAGAAAGARAERTIALAGPLPLAGHRGVLRTLLAWQAAARPNYGAWLGLRARRGGLARKLYVEVPEGTPWAAWERATAGAASLLPAASAELCMVGLDPGDGRLELYYGLERLSFEDLEALLSSLRLPPRGGEVVALLERLWRRRIRRRLPPGDWGFSVALDPGGRADAFSLYSIAEELLGDDGRIRAAVLEFGRRMGWSMAAYAAMTGPLAAATGVDAYHGMVGVTVARSGTLGFTATVAPPGGDRG